MSQVPATLRGEAASRLGFVDALRLFLTILVVLVHASVTYGGEGSWYYKEVGAGTPERLLLTSFNAVCQSFFMGLFYFLAGCFTPGSHDRKGLMGFLSDRLLRLGVPMLAYDFLLEPVVLYILREPSSVEPSFLDLYGEYLAHKPGIGAGPLWFVEGLLIFSAAYALVRLLRGGRPSLGPRGGTPPATLLVLFATLVGLLTFAVRLLAPLGSCFEPLNFQMPFFVQYVALFGAGVLAGRRGWLDAFSGEAGRGWGPVAAATTLALPLLLLAGGGSGGDFSAFLGGPRWQALALALWESISCVAMSIWLLRLFRARASSPGRLARECARSAYGVYIIHAPILVLVSRLARPLDLSASAKFAGVAAVVLVLCFAASAFLRRLPGLRRVL